MVGRVLPSLAAALLCAAASGQSIYTYIGQVSETSALIAWGAATGRTENTIGRDSKPLGAAQVRIGGRTMPTGQKLDRGHRTPTRHRLPV